jgi:uncharacterized protein
VIPLGIGAFKCGSARGTTLSFLTSAPTISPVAVLLAFSLLGPQITFIFIGVVLLGSLLTGVIGNRALGGEKEAVFRATMADLKDGKQLEDSSNKTLGQKVRGAFRWAFWDLGSDVSIDLLFGLSLAAAILAFLPREWISTWLGRQHLATLFYVILIGLPVYTCSVPSIPVVRSLLLMGMSPGAAVAYMIAGPATNLGELNAIRRSMGLNTAVFFASSLFIMALSGGLIADNLVFADYVFKPAVLGQQMITTGCCVPAIFGDAAQPLSEHVRNVPAWHYPFILALAVTLLLGASRRIHGALVKSKPTVPAQTQTVVSSGD